VETEQRRELMQTCETWLSSQLPTACLERRAYEAAVTPTHLLLVEQWLDEGAMNSYYPRSDFAR
jgi:quinol monooxygenase YgiN